MEMNEEYKAHMQEIIRAMPATLFFKDTEGKYVFTTKVCDMVNAGPEGTIVGKWDVDIQFDKTLGRRYYEEDMQILKTGKSTHCIDHFYHPDGTECYLEILKEAIHNDEGEIIGIVGICNEVTELEQLRRKYASLSLHDPMTGVYTRNYTLEYQFDREDCLPCSYIFCDCDRLKKINDEFGHEVGDTYIVEAAGVLKNCALDNSVVVRWGGDEFLMITPNCSEEAQEELLDRIHAGQKVLSDIKPGMGLSCGGMVRESMEVPESLVMKQADERMYANKRERSVC